MVEDVANDKDAELLDPTLLDVELGGEEVSDTDVEVWELELGSS